jgi:hypothetical protein
MFHSTSQILYLQIPAVSPTWHWMTSYQCDILVKLPIIQNLPENTVFLCSISTNNVGQLIIDFSWDYHPFHRCKSSIWIMQVQDTGWIQSYAALISNDVMFPWRYPGCSRSQVPASPLLWWWESCQRHQYVHFYSLGMIYFTYHVLFCSACW